MADQIQLCSCGCGQPTKPARQTDRARGVVKGAPQRFLCGHNGKPRPAASTEQRMAISVRQRGELGNNWKGGVHLYGGYRKLRAVGHPFADRHGYVYEHRLVMERIIGRYLLPSEKVHHLNRDKLDNRAANLVYCATHSLHIQRHHSDEIAVQSAVATLRAHRPELLMERA